MMFRRRALLLASLARCTAPEPSAGIVQIAPGALFCLPGARELGRSIEAAQMVRATYRGRDIGFEGQLSVTSERLLLACIDLLGRPGMTVRWEKPRVSAQVADWFPTTLPPENMLADIMLIYWPLMSVRHGLAASGLAVIDEANRRVALSGQRPVIEIEYRSDDPWNGTAFYNSVLWGYTLEVQSVEVRA
jgi:hypothetical protein